MTGASSAGAYLNISSVVWLKPRIAQQADSRKFLVVAAVDTVAAPHVYNIGARFREADGTVGAEFILKGATPSYECYDPDVGGEFVPTSVSYFCVAYNRIYSSDRDVWAIIVDSDGNFVGSEIPLAIQVLRDEGEPEVCRSTGSPSGATRFNVAWPVRHLTSDTSSVEAAQLSYDGSTLYGPYSVMPPDPNARYENVDVSTCSDRVHPVSGRQYYLVTFDNVGTVFDTGYVAVCSGTEAHSTERIETRENSFNPRPQDLRIATTANYFILGYEDAGELFATIAEPIHDDLGITERRLVSAGASPYLFRPGISMCSTLEGGSISRDALTVYSQLIGLPNGILAIYGSRAIATPLDAAGWQYCESPRNSTDEGGFIQAFGGGSANLAHLLVASSLPTNSFGFFLASRDAGYTPNAGGSEGTLCVSGSIGRFGTFNSGSQGRSQFTLNPQAIAQPTGTTAAMAGHVWRFQCWHRDSVGGMATSNFTNAVAIPFM